MSLHPLLVRQLRKAGLMDGADAPPAWRDLLDRVSRSYSDADESRHMFEHAMGVSSQEMRDLHHRLQAERDAAWRKLHGAPVGIFEADVRGILIEVNPAFEAILGAGEPLRGRSLFDVVDASAALAFRAAFDELGTGAVGTCSGEHGLRGGDSPVWAQWSLAAVRHEHGHNLVGVVADVSERRRLQVELLHAQKLESVGRLAAGVAHEINTPIQFIGDNTRFVRDGVADLVRYCDLYRALHAAATGQPAAIDETIDPAEAAAEIDYLRGELPMAIAATLEGVGRVATIVHAMKVFAHPDGQGQSPADLALAVRSTAAVATNEIKYVARVEFEIDHLPQVTCCLGDINQVILNLLVNAAHAIGDRHGTDPEVGCIRIRAWSEPPWVVIAISDNGTGIAPEHQQKLFEPFFTTKDVGKGTGQGLALARAVVVEKHRGALTFETEVGHGTTFFIRLPVAGVAVAADDAA